jgi:hypothetical protein
MSSPNGKEIAGATAGGAAGTCLGLAGSAGIVSSAGAVAGLSGAGITSGLAAVGGSILGGAAVLTCGTVIFAAAGAFAGWKFLSRKSR